MSAAAAAEYDLAIIALKGNMYEGMACTACAALLVREKSDEGEARKADQV